MSTERKVSAVEKQKASKIEKQTWKLCTDAASLEKEEQLDSLSPTDWFHLVEHSTFS